MPQSSLAELWRMEVESGPPERMAEGIVQHSSIHQCHGQRLKGRWLTVRHESIIINAEISV